MITDYKYNYYKEMFNIGSQKFICFVINLY